MCGRNRGMKSEGPSLKNGGFTCLLPTSIKLPAGPIDENFAPKTTTGVCTAVLTFTGGSLDEFLKCDHPKAIEVHQRRRLPAFMFYRFKDDNIQNPVAMVTSSISLRGLSP